MSDVTALTTEDLADVIFKQCLRALEMYGALAPPRTPKLPAVPMAPGTPWEERERHVLHELTVAGRPLSAMQIHGRLPKEAQMTPSMVREALNRLFRRDAICRRVEERELDHGGPSGHRVYWIQA